MVHGTSISRSPRHKDLSIDQTIIANQLHTTASQAATAPLPKASSSLPPVESEIGEDRLKERKEVTGLPENVLVEAEKEQEKQTKEDLPNVKNEVPATTPSAMENEIPAKQDLQGQGESIPAKTGVIKVDKSTNVNLPSDIGDMSHLQEDGEKDKDGMPAFKTEGPTSREIDVEEKGTETIPDISYSNQVSSLRPASSSIVRPSTASSGLKRAQSARGLRARVHFADEVEVHDNSSFGVEQRDPRFFLTEEDNKMASNDNGILLPADASTDIEHKAMDTSTEDFLMDNAATRDSGVQPVSDMPDGSSMEQNGQLNIALERGHQGSDNEVKTE